MKRVQARRWLLIVLNLVGLGALIPPMHPQGQQVTLTPGTTLFALDLSRTPVGELPANLDLVNGNLEVVLKNGVPMLKASALTEFRITLQPPGQVLPPDFSLEFDLIPKQGSNPQDLSVEGTATINQGDASAHVLWHATGSLSVIGGGGESYETPMPEDLQASLPGVLTKVVLEVEGPTIRLYTNGRRLYTLQKHFARGAVLRVYLGALNGGTEAVYLAGLRVIAGVGPTFASQQSAMTGALTSSTTMINSGTSTRSPVVTAQSMGRNAGTLGTLATTSSSQVVSTPPAPPASNVILAPPVGAGAPPPSSQQPVVGTPGSMRLDNVAFNLLLLKGGSSAGGVVETRLADGSLKKSLATVSVEPLVFEVGLGSPVEAWLQSMLTGAATFKNGSLFGGVVPAQQELSFQNGLLTSVTLPTLDASSSTPGFLQVTVQPEQTAQTALASAASTTLTSWLSSDFRFTMGNLETTRAVRIESFTIAAPLSSSAVGAQRIATTTSAGQPAISNLLISFAVDAAHPVPNWLAWYDSFVLKGNNGDSQEQSFLLELGVGSTGAGGSHRLALKGSGVGLVALRVLPQTPGSTVQRLQAELYVERMDVVP